MKSLILTLEPAGLVYNIDMIILEEELIYGVGYAVTLLLGKKIPGSEKIPWLGSEVNYKESVAFYCTKYIRRGIIHYDLLTQSDLG